MIFFKKIPRIEVSEKVKNAMLTINEYISAGNKEFTTEEIGKLINDLALAKYLIKKLRTTGVIERIRLERRLCKAQKVTKEKRLGENVYFECVYKVIEGKL